MTIHVKPEVYDSPVLAIVERSAVTRALGLDSDPLDDNGDTWFALWRGFGEHLVAQHSIFRIVHTTGQPSVKVRSGDRRTACTIAIDRLGVPSGERCEAGNNLDVPGRFAWPALYAKVEQLAYDQRAPIPCRVKDKLSIGSQDIRLIVTKRTYRGQAVR